MVIVIRMVVAIESVMIEVEHVEQIANGRHVDRDIRTIIIHPRIGKIVAAALAELAEGPVTLTPAGSGADYYMSYRSLSRHAECGT